jgi:hypothetical protein
MSSLCATSHEFEAMRAQAHWTGDFLQGGR